MGLLDSARATGERLFSREAEAAARIKEHVAGVHLVHPGQKIRVPLD